MLAFASWSFRIHIQNTNCICQICQALGKVIILASLQVSNDEGKKKQFFFQSIFKFILMHGKELSIFPLYMDWAKSKWRKKRKTVMIWSLVIFFFFQYQVSQQLDFGGGTLEKDTWEYLLHFNFW